MYVFSPIPSKTLQSSGEGQISLKENAAIKFGNKLSPADVLVEPVWRQEEVKRQQFSKFTFKNQSGWARVVFEIEDIDLLFASSALEQEVELSFSAFGLDGERARFDLISILQTPKDVEYFQVLSTFGRDLSFQYLKGRPHVLKTRIKREALEADGRFVLAFQVRQGSTPFFLSPIVLSPVAPDRQVCQVADSLLEIPSRNDSEIPLEISGKVETKLTDTPVAEGQQRRALTLMLQPNSSCGVSIDLDAFAKTSRSRSLKIDALLQPGSSQGDACARIERGGLFGANCVTLNHNWDRVTGAGAARRFQATVPCDDGLSGRKLVFSFTSGKDAVEYQLDISLEGMKSSAPFKAPKRPTLVLSQDFGERNKPLPSLFDRSFAAQSLPEVESSGANGATTELNEQTLWELYSVLAPGEMDPHPLFSTAWHYRSLEFMGLPKRSDPAASFEAYLAGESAADPHPLIDEAYLREQLASKRGNRSGLECFLSCADLDLNPNRLFHTRAVAKAMRDMGEDLPSESNAVLVLQRYLEIPRFWTISTSPLFDPHTIPAGDRAPLALYLNEQSLWMISPTPLFDAEHYCGQKAVPRLRRVAPLAEYLALERQVFPDPGPLFQSRFFAMQADTTWSGGASPLETFVTTLEGTPHARFDRASYLSQAPDEKIFGLTVSDIVQAGKSMDGPRHLLRKSAKLVNPIVQMTGPSPRNPYYKQMPEAFLAAKQEFRFSNNPEEMVKYSSIKKGGYFWWHQLEPFYHDANSLVATRDRTKRLVDMLSTMKSNGAKLIHTWHNALPYDGKYRDIDYQLLLDVAPLFDLILLHAERGVPWIKKFAPSANTHVVPHPSLVRHFNTQIHRDVARDILKIPRSVFLVLSFGEMKAYKRVDLLVEAWAKFKTSDRSADTALALTGHWKERTATFDAAHRLPDCMIVDELMPDSRLALWIAAADVCAFSHPQVWASGAVMTALSFGKPTIVPDETGLTDVVQDEQNGFVFKNGDPDSLADAISRARDFPYPEHAAFLNHAKAAELHPFRLQPQISTLFEGI